MKAIEKQNREVVATVLAGMIGREYQIDDNLDPVIECGTNGLRPGSQGVYKTLENRIVIRPSEFTVDTLAHELAHWVENTLFGDSDCKAAPHYRIQKAIEAKIIEWGYAKDIVPLW